MALRRCGALINRRVGSACPVLPQAPRERQSRRSVGRSEQSASSSAGPESTAGATPAPSEGSRDKSLTDEQTSAPHRPVLYSAAPPLIPEDLRCTIRNRTRIRCCSAYRCDIAAGDSADDDRREHALVRHWPTRSKTDIERRVDAASSDDDGDQRRSRAGGDPHRNWWGTPAAPETVSGQLRADSGQSPRSPRQRCLAHALPSRRALGKEQPGAVRDGLAACAGASQLHGRDRRKREN